MKKGEQLRDIKPLLEISDNSIYLYWGLIALGVIVLLALLYYLFKRLISMHKINTEQEYLDKLYAIDWSNPKKAAYRVTYYGRLLATDEHRQEIFTQLKPMLDQYKYRKTVAIIDRKTIQQFNLFRKICDESI